MSYANFYKLCSFLAEQKTTIEQEGMTKAQCMKFCGRNLTFEVTTSNLEHAIETLKEQTPKKAPQLKKTAQSRPKDKNQDAYALASHVRNAVLAVVTYLGDESLIKAVHMCLQGRPAEEALDEVTRKSTEAETSISKVGKGDRPEANGKA